MMQESISMAFISEPQVYQADINSYMDYIKAEYCYFLNSEDLHNSDIPMITSHATGGTLCIWRRSLDPYVTIHPVTSSSFTPLILSLPYHQKSIHICIYLPTHGKDDEFVAELAELKTCIDELVNKHPGAALYIRGDGNVNMKNIKRVSLLGSFMKDFSLTNVPIGHKTYHHFTGAGAHDSNVDVLLHSASLQFPEYVTRIICKNQHPSIFSHHDIILSSFSLPPLSDKSAPNPDLITAPRVIFPRVRINWDPDGVKKYENLVSPHLQRIRDRWKNPDSLSSMSVLLKMTNTILSSSASATNHSKTLSGSITHKSKRVPKSIVIAEKRLSRIFRKLRNSKNKLADLKTAKQEYKSVVRRSRLKEGFERDRKLFEILDENPNAAFAFIKSCRRKPTASIKCLKVGAKLYEGSSVCDGFYDSMSSIKRCDLDMLRDHPRIAEHLNNHEHILKLCQEKKTIPQIELAASTKLLKRMKKKVSDIFSITALHYLNAGMSGHIHFNFLLNMIISNTNNATMEELNLVHGVIHHKSHNKDKTSERAYRTISSCPFLAKATDLYLSDLYQQQWNNCQADTQYQGQGSSHELAALLVTEVIQFSLNVLRQPVFLLSLDAQSAYDRCLRQILSSELYKANTRGSALTFIDNRLAHRATVYQWEDTMMGPSKDDTGFEQGGINSSSFYKLYNNEQLITAQQSRLGVDIGSSVISAVGQADDVVHLANNVDDLRLLVAITESYCKKFRVTLVPSKTKLLAFSNPSQDYQVELAKLLNPIKINNTPVQFCSEVEHVGVIRHTAGNLPNILNRIVAHKKSLGAMLSAGMARSHRGNPAASLRVHTVFNSPILFSGLAALILTKPEIRILDSHYLKTLQNLQRLHDKTPRAVTLFMAGSLPGEAILHTRQLSLLSMISRLQGNCLNIHGQYILSCYPKSSKSWFHQVRDICLQYSLPHPIQLLQQPMTKQHFKSLVQKKVTLYWERLLRNETLELSSLIVFNSTNLFLNKPSLLWLFAGSNSFEVAKSIVVAKMISGKYRSDHHCRHWTPTNRDGYCLAETCIERRGDIVHILFECPALSHARDRLYDFWLSKTRNWPELLQLIEDILTMSPIIKTHFVLDPPQIPTVLRLATKYEDILGHIYYLTRTFVYYMHREREILFDRWPGDHGRKQRPLNRVKLSRKPKNPLHHPQPTNHYSVAGPLTAPTTTSLYDLSSTSTAMASPNHNTGRAIITRTEASTISHSMSLPYSAASLPRTDTVINVPLYLATTDTARWKLKPRKLSQFAASAAGQCLCLPAPGSERPGSDTEQEIHPQPRVVLSRACCPGLQDGESQHKVLPHHLAVNPAEGGRAWCSKMQNV